MEETKRHVAVWFDIPVESLERSIDFYSKVFGFHFEIQSMGDVGRFAVFPNAMETTLPGAAGSLFESKNRKPSSSGVLIYFTSPSGELSNELAKVESAGGKVIQEKIEIPGGDWGYMGLFEDTEGNQVAIHSMKG